MHAGLRNVARAENRLFFSQIKDSDGVSLDLEENPHVASGSHDVDARHSLEGLGIPADSLIAIPVFEAREPRVNALNAIGIESPQSDVYCRGCDDRLHGLAQGFRGSWDDCRALPHCSKHAAARDAKKM